MKSQNFFKLVVGLFIGLVALNVGAEDAAPSLNACREAYANFLKSDMRFSGSATAVVGACQVTLPDTQTRQLLSKALAECWRKNPSLTSDNDVDPEAAVRRNKCTAGKAHDIAVSHAKPQKHAGFLEDCLKSGKSRTECLEILVGEHSPGQLYKRTVEAGLHPKTSETSTGIN